MKEKLYTKEEVKNIIKNFLIESIDRGFLDNIINKVLDNYDNKKKY